MKPTLLIMAAGMGSRYGGLKQLEVCGMNGETVMDYSIFDAISSGFGKIIFIIRQDFEQEFYKKILQKYKKHISIEVVFQDINQLPQGTYGHFNRVKPWGTNHAVMAAKSKIDEPFAVINADDFYGKDSFRILANVLKTMEYTQNYYVMIGFFISNTLSENGGVSRGICTVNKDSFLLSIVERTNILQDIKGQIFYINKNTKRIKKLHHNTITSMNMWGFTPEYFDYSEYLFVDFLNRNLNNSTAEFFIPYVVNQLLKDKKIKVKVLNTNSMWFGTTYLKDLTIVKSKICNLIKQGDYPEKLF